MSQLSHALLVSIRSSLYQEVSTDGICMGLIQMGIQAFLSGENEFKEFLERLEFIASHPDFFAGEDSFFNRTRNKVIDNLQQFANTNLLENLKSENLHFNKIKNNIVAKRTAAREEEKLALLSQGKTLPPYVKVEVALTELEQKTIDLAAFFEGIELYFNPEHYKRQLGHTLTQSNTVKISEYVGSDKLQALGGRINAGAFAGIYNRDGLNTYMNLLDEKVKIAGVDVAFELAQPDHIISLCYNSKREQWWYIDANDLPPVAATPDQITEMLEHAFRSVSDVNTQALTGFTTQITGTGNNKQELQSIFDSLKQSNVFQDLHAITPENMNRKTHEYVSLALACDEY